ncbi:MULTISPECIES: hypothetical protein [Enterococcus]|uniref:Uncharacterized protein n=1 Tax=Candidatus Enterococcus mangumiae TaxID=2230878 RepID=A0ABZ2T1L2_9ENTE|nr:MULTISPECIES: hypothetical protein [unclassified Enterococcus]MBO0489606.1 hypothetical protein [Enterococcus sp. DIV1094]MBO1298424.1 hypothetical protein [Enterococcus sp. DIV1271a]
MTYARILKGTSFILLVSSIYFAAQQNPIYFTLILLSILIESAQPNRPKIPYQSKRKAIYLPNQTYGTEMKFEFVLMVLVAILCFVLATG